ERSWRRVAAVAGSGTEQALRQVSAGRGALRSRRAKPQGGGPRIEDSRGDALQPADNSQRAPRETAESSGRNDVGHSASRVDFAERSVSGGAGAACVFDDQGGNAHCHRGHGGSRDLGARRRLVGIGNQRNAAEQTESRSNGSAAYIFDGPWRWVFSSGRWAAG